MSGRKGEGEKMQSGGKKKKMDSKGLVTLE